MSDAPTEYGHEFRRVGSGRRVGEPLTVQEFEQLAGLNHVAVVLQRRRPGRRADISGVLFLKARYVEVVDHQLKVREGVTLSLSTSF